MEAWKQAILNAGIMAGLSAIPIWMAYETVDYTMVKAVGGTFCVTFLTLCARYYKPPKSDVNNDAIIIETTVSTVEKGKNKKILGMLWF